MSKQKPHPFLKWAGGKGRMLSHILERLPQKWNRFYEPFIGGGSVYFELARQKRFKKAVIGDANPHLMNAYNVIKDDVEGLITELCLPYYKYEKSVYLLIRSVDPKNLTPVQAAARFIYLNRTCFNGLYRVNSEGRFNVPFGSYKNPVICDAENLRAVSESLRTVRLEHGDFEWILKEPKRGDVVYFDPPYVPTSATSKFTSYTEGGFSSTDHARLASVFTTLADRGVTTILSNSGAPMARKLYRDFEIVNLVGARNVGGPAEYRKPVQEIMVVANVLSSAKEQAQATA